MATRSRKLMHSASEPLESFIADLPSRNKREESPRRGIGLSSIITQREGALGA
jgi:hypothetical protein